MAKESVEILKGKLDVENLISQLNAALSEEWLAYYQSAHNNAGIQTPQRPMAEITDEEFDRTVAVDLRSFFCSQLAIAERSNFSTLAAASFEEHFKTPSALFTSIPRIISATRRILRGEVGTFCNLAKYMVLRAVSYTHLDVYKRQLLLTPAIMIKI